MPVVNLSPVAAGALKAVPGDLIYITDRRWWLGGLRSTHAVVGAIDIEEDKAVVEIGPQTWPIVVGPSRTDRLVKVERLY